MANRPTNIRMPEQTYRQIERLQEWGFGNTKAAIVALAVDRLYELALRRMRVEMTGPMEPGAAGDSSANE